MHDLFSRTDNPITQKKFIVFLSALLSLFTKCFSCSASAETLTESIGTFIRIKMLCPLCSYQYTWESQPLINSIPAGNLALSTAILCSGSLPTKTITLFKLMNCSTINESTYFKYQRNYLNQAIQTTWIEQQNSIIASFKKNKDRLILGGDGRCDSPGYCAKFGSYTFLELQNNVITDIQLVQVSTCMCCVVIIISCTFIE